jgi:hypothetical protein
MICPHCRASLLRKQRTGNRCSSCRREFAFDPKTNRLRLHDLRVQDLARTLSTRGRDGLAPLGYTADQLRFAASRKALASTSTSSGWVAGAWLVGIGGVVLGFGSAIAGSGAMFGAVAVGVLVVLGLLALGHVLTAGRRRYPGLPVGAGRFATMLTRWNTVYGQPPSGLLPAASRRPVAPAGLPRALLLCPDPDTVAFLAAAGLAARHPVLLVPGPAENPPPEVVAAARDGLPVLLLHDADARGCLAVRRLRTALPGARVIDVGLRPRVARGARVTVRERPPSGALAELRAAGDLAADELAWLEEGNGLPLAAVLPARLLRAVERAVERVQALDPDQARARSVGFLSGPPW